jgi:hypothetical protein
VSRLTGFGLAASALSLGALWALTSMASMTSEAMAAPHGQVIRIERSGNAAHVAPRLCEIRGDTGTCVGEEPRVGQTVVVLDERRVLAELQILEVASVVAACPNLWTVKARGLRGTVSDNGNNGIGVIDPALHPTRAHVLDKDRAPAAPDGVPGVEVWRAIDRDGDGTADILITRYTCDASGRPITSGSTACIDVWAKLGPRMMRTTQLNFAQCNI